MDVQEIKIQNVNMDSNALLSKYVAIRKVLYELLNAQEIAEKNYEILKEKQAQENKIRNKEGIVGKSFSTIGIILFVISTSGGFVGGIVGLIILIILFVIGMKLDKMVVKDKFIIQADKYHETDVIPAIDVVEQNKKVVEKVWEKEEMSIYEHLVPEEYRSLEILEYFIHALEIGRASNQKELINLYEEEQHRRRVEASQAEILNTQKQQLSETQKQNNQLLDIKKKQQKISRQVKYGNILNTIDFFTKK